jgi:hypothetical protein
MRGSDNIQIATTEPLSNALAAWGVVGWALVLAMTWALSKQAGASLAVGTVVLGIFALLVSRPVLVVYALICAGPFYELSRAVLFPGIELLGFWQDVLVAILGIVAIRNVLRDGMPRLRLLDGLVLGFIAAYALSIFVSADNRVWFYGFRWVVLYPSMYLALRTFKFNPRQERWMLALLGGSLVVSAIVGLVAMWYLGWDAAVELYEALNVAIFTRNDQWRWAATFTNPIVTSSAFSLLLFLFIGLANFRTKSQRIWLIGAGFAAVCIYLTHSRTGIVISVVGTLAILFAVNSRFARPLLAAALIVSGVLAVQIVRSFDDWDSFRLQQFSRTVSEAITNYPMGTGAGTAGAVSMAAASFAGQDRLSVDTVVGDSVILTVLRDTGWVGVLFYIGACLAVVRLAWRARGTLAGVVALALWCGSFANLMNSTDVYPTKLYLWLFASLAVVHADEVEPPLMQGTRANSV